MVSATVTVTNSSGLHARPANVFVKEALLNSGCSISINKDGKSYNGKSIVSVLSACIKCGTQIEISVEGDGEQQVLENLVTLIETGLNE